MLIQYVDNINHIIYSALSSHVIHVGLAQDVVFQIESLGQKRNYYNTLNVSLFPLSPARQLSRSLHHQQQLSSPPKAYSPSKKGKQTASKKTTTAPTAKMGMELPLCW